MPHVYVHCPDPTEFDSGFSRLRNDFAVPEQFPTAVLAAAHEAASSEDPFPRTDATHIEFVAIDPAGSTDLDQAYHAVRRSNGYRVHYAIADVARFVSAGSILDTETRQRGMTFYAPDLRAPLHPEVLSEGAASLLADVDRPAILWTIDLDESGSLVDARAERATVRNRQQLSYRRAQQMIDGGRGSDSLALLREVGRLRQGLADARGAVSLELPGQELVGSDGAYELRFDEVFPIEGWNAQISLLTGMAAAAMMIDAKVGIVRTLPPPDEKTVTSLRRSSLALGVPFPEQMRYGEWVSSLDPQIPKHVALMTQATHGLRGAGYQSFDGERPLQSQHSAIAADYTHVTAPLRRLVDRFTSEIAIALSADKRPPGWVLEALPGLPKVMQKAKSRESRYERALVDFAEALVLSDRIGETFQATVVDVGKEATTIQLAEPAVIATIEPGQEQLGEALTVRLTATDVYARTLTFTVA